MNDPHVESLTYRVVTPADVSFHNPPVIDGDLPAFRYRLENGSLTVTLKDHFATAREARDCVDDFLRAWELDAALKADRSEFGFEFQQSHIIERKPSSALGKVVGTIDMLVMAEKAKAAKVNAAYPPAPAGLRPSLDTETMWHHYSRYLEDRENITSMGFFCLSLLQWRTGSTKARQVVADQYKIQKDVLDTLGTLTSDVGDLTTARKLESTSQVRAHTAKEVEWIKAAVKALIRRKAEYDYDPAATLPEIKMSDLPAL
jgi:hypothetical protein